MGPFLSEGKRKKEVRIYEGLWVLGSKGPPDDSNIRYRGRKPLNHPLYLIAYFLNIRFSLLSSNFSSNSLGFILLGCKAETEVMRFPLVHSPHSSSLALQNKHTTFAPPAWAFLWKCCAGQVLHSSPHSTSHLIPVFLPFYRWIFQLFSSDLLDMLI